RSDLNAVGCLTTDWFLRGCKADFPKTDDFANLVFTLFPVNFLNSFLILQLQILFPEVEL
ncbi:hypothetical protein Tco_0426689, partial [Tanacetum coccineum]